MKKSQSDTTQEETKTQQGCHGTFGLFVLIVVVVCLFQSNESGESLDDVSKEEGRIELMTLLDSFLRSTFGSHVL